MALGAVLERLFMRQSSYPHMVRESLLRLADEELEGVLVRELGVSLPEIVAVAEAIEDLHAEAWGLRFDGFRLFGVFACAEHAKYLRAAADASNGGIATVSDEVRAEAAEGEPSGHVAQDL